MSQEEGKIVSRTTNVTKTDWLTSLATKPTTRRQFLKVTGLGGMATVALAMIGCAPKKVATVEKPKRVVYVPAANMLIVQDPTKCVNCRLCEQACTLFNEGKVDPTLTRIKINRNINFGPRGAQAGSWSGEGIFGNFRTAAELCRQCPHPVPCMDACPHNAIEVVPPTNARVVNVDKCQGCRTCQRACPWAMTTFDEETKKASKCHLCYGKPECVLACPTGALSYIPWIDRTKEIAPRYVTAAVELPAEVAASCVDCHGSASGGIIPVIEPSTVKK